MIGSIGEGGLTEIEIAVMRGEDVSFIDDSFYGARMRLAVATEVLLRSIQKAMEIN